MTLIVIKPKINQLIKLNSYLPKLCYDLEMVDCTIKDHVSPLSKVEN